MSRGIAIDFGIDFGIDFAIDLPRILPRILPPILLGKLTKAPTPPKPGPKNGLQQHLTRENISDPYLTDRLRSQIVAIPTLRVSFVTSVLQNRRYALLMRPLEIFARSKYFTCPLAQFSAHQNFRHATLKILRLDPSNFSDVSGRHICFENGLPA